MDVGDEHHSHSLFCHRQRRLSNCGAGLDHEEIVTLPTKNVLYTHVLVSFLTITTSHLGSEGPLVLLALPFRLVQPLGDLLGHCVFANCCDDEAIAGHDFATAGAERKAFWSKRLPIVGSLRTAIPGLHHLAKQIADSVMMLI